MSDTCSRGEAVDLSGPHLQKLIDDKFGVKNIRYKLVPDEIEQIEVCTFSAALNMIITIAHTSYTGRSAPVHRYRVDQCYLHEWRHGIRSTRRDSGGDETGH